MVIGFNTGQSSLRTEVDFRLLHSLDTQSQQFVQGDSITKQASPLSVPELLKQILLRIKNKCWRCFCLDGYPPQTTKTHSVTMCRNNRGCLECKSRNHSVKNCLFKTSNIHHHLNIAMNCRYCKLPKFLHSSNDQVSKTDCKTGGLDNTMMFLGEMYAKRNQWLVSVFGEGNWTDSDSFFGYILADGMQGYTRVVELFVKLFK